MKRKISVTIVSTILLSACYSQSSVSDKIWLSTNNPEFFINEVMDVDWEEKQIKIATNQHGQVIFSSNNTKKWG